MNHQRIAGPLRDQGSSRERRLKLLADHTEHCVMEVIQSGGGSKKVHELNDAVERLVRG